MIFVIVESVFKKKGIQITMIILDKSFKELFKDFCKTNNIENMQVAIQYFTVFGGLDIKIDTTKPILELIEKNILNNYNYLRNEVNQLTGGYHVEHAILSGIALGDRKTTNAFKRAHVSFEEGMKCVDSLYEKAIIDIDSSEHFLLGKRGDSKAVKKAKEVKVGDIIEIKYLEKSEKFKILQIPSTKSTPKSKIDEYVQKLN